MSWEQQYSRSALGPVTSVASGFHFPSSMAFDTEGNAYVGETGIGFAKTPRGGKVWKVTQGGEKSLLAEGFGLITGLVFHDGSLWVSQGSGRIDRLWPDGTTMNVLDNLPTGGNYHTGEVAFGPDGKMYWGQGSMTNMGIVGLDALIMGWLKKLPHSVDIPGYDIVLNDVRVETRDPFNIEDPDATIETGPYTQIGETMPQGTRIAGQAPATAAIHRANPDGSELEMIAWGVRNAFGLRFPKVAFARLLRLALTPPEEALVLPFTADQEAKARLFVSLLLRPLVCPATATEPEKTMEIRFFAPGSLVGNLDFVEAIFGNGGDPSCQPGRQRAGDDRLGRAQRLRPPLPARWPPTGHGPGSG